MPFAKPQHGTPPAGKQWSDVLPLNRKQPGCRDDRAVKVVSGRGFRHVVPFPYKLHVMLGEVEQVGADYIVSWLPNGTSFKVHASDDFINSIVPLYFKQRQYKSFQRQLHLYGFQRHLDGPEKGAYFHPCFVRDDRNLCYQVARKMNKADKKANRAIKSKPAIKPAPAATPATSFEIKKEDSAPRLSSPRQELPRVPPKLMPVAAPSAVLNQSVPQPQLDDSELDAFDNIDQVLDAVGESISPLRAPTFVSGPPQVVSMPQLSTSENLSLPLPPPVPEPASSANYANTLSWLLGQGIPIASLSSALHADPISPQPVASLPTPELTNTVICLFNANTPKRTEQRLQPTVSTNPSPAPQPEPRDTAAASPITALLQMTEGSSSSVSDIFAPDSILWTTV